MGGIAARGLDMFESRHAMSVRLIVTVLTGDICFPMRGAMTGAATEIFFRAAAEQIRDKK